MVMMTTLVRTPARAFILVIIQYPIGSIFKCWMLFYGLGNLVFGEADRNKLR